MDSLAQRFPDDFLQSVVDRLGAPAGGWSELFLESCRTTTIEWDSREGVKLTPGSSEGFTLRWVDSDRQRHFSEEGLDPDRILAAVKPGGASDRRNPRLKSSGSESAGLEDEGGRLRSLLDTFGSELVKGVGEAERLSLRLEWRVRETCVAGPGRRAARNRHTRAVLTGRVVVGGHLFASGMGAEDPDSLRLGSPISRIRADLALRRQARREGEPAPEGEQVIILAPPSGGVFFHEACGHALEADLILREASPFRTRLGERVAPAEVGAGDDPRRPGLEGSYEWDDEGTAGQGTILIDGGVLRGFLTDRITGARLGVESTGNGRRESFRDAPLPRMSNTFLMAGPHDPEEILRDTAAGVYVRCLEGGRVDPCTGDFQFRAGAGSRIENGRLTAPLRPFSLSGNGPAALRSIERIGNDLSFGDGAGSCGKDGQRVPVAAGQPTLRLQGIFIHPT